MARLAACLVLVIAPCPVLRAPISSAPVGTVVTSSPPSPAVSTPRLVRATTLVVVRRGQPRKTAGEHGGLVGRERLGFRPPRLTATSPTQATRTTLSHQKPRRAVKTSRKPLTAREFAANLPRPWPAIVRCEALNDGSWKVSSDSHARGLFQFLRSSWRLVHGHGDPAAASFDEQWSRAQSLWRLQGWGAWECSRIVGVR